jgi:aspartyl/glutamyl-tRNA(Asn/Gln) amidotransferase C subunit
MAEITKETIEKLLALARIGLSEDEKKNKEPKLVEDLKRILAHVEELSEVNTEGVERVSGGYAGRNAYRSDAEIKKFYDDAVKAQTEANKKLPKDQKPQPIPALKDVKAQIQQQLVLQKQQTQAAAFVQALRAKAKVETTLK